MHNYVYDKIGLEFKKRVVEEDLVRELEAGGLPGFGLLLGWLRKNVVDLSSLDESRLTLPVFWNRKEDRCPICLEDLVEDTLVLSCMHVFHRACVRTEFVDRCPLCKMTLNDLSWIEGRKARMERVKNYNQDEEEEEENRVATPERNAMTLRKRKRRT